MPSPSVYFLKISGVFGAALLMVAAPVASRAETSRVTVSYGDLDLRTEAGAASLARRVQSAARTVCLPLEGRSVQDYSRFAACREAAVASARIETVVAAARSPTQYARLAGPTAASQVQ